MGTDYSVPSGTNADQAQSLCARGQSGLSPSLSSARLLRPTRQRFAAEWQELDPFLCLAHPEAVEFQRASVSAPEVHLVSPEWPHSLTRSHIG